jgi:hypothetical protein
VENASQFSTLRASKKTRLNVNRKRRVGNAQLAHQLFQSHEPSAKPISTHKKTGLNGPFLYQSKTRLSG